jgi:hypothetical protein
MSEIAVHSKSILFFGGVVFVNTQVLSEIVVTAETLVAVWVWAGVGYIGLSYEYTFYKCSVETYVSHECVYS